MMKSLQVRSRVLFSVLALMCILSYPSLAQTGSRSIRSWVHCDGKTDDDAGVAAAFAAAKDGAFTLVVDCPVFFHVGTDIRRPVYIDNGTTVQFTGNGLFKVDNAGIPAFVIANSAKIRLLGWRIQYVGGLQITNNWTGYYDNGSLVQGKIGPAAAFAGKSLAPWMVAHRGMSFAQSAPWGGLTNGAAIFYIVGSTKDLEVRSMKMFVALTPKAVNSSQWPSHRSVIGTTIRKIL